MDGQFCCSVYDFNGMRQIIFMPLAKFINNGYNFPEIDYPYR
jgi:hypothetical protein